MVDLYEDMYKPSRSRLGSWIYLLFWLADGLASRSGAWVSFASEASLAYRPATRIEQYPSYLDFPEIGLFMAKFEPGRIVFATSSRPLAEKVDQRRIFLKKFEALRAPYRTMVVITVFTLVTSNAHS